MSETSNIEKKENSSTAETTEMFDRFWNETRAEIEAINIMEFRTNELPLARIKKIMKLDDDVKMISAEVPILFAKAAEIFIHELTLRAWLHTEESKRRTLQRNDVAMAISKHEQFDFLIDIVPREESKPQRKHENNSGEVQYIFTIPQANSTSAIQLSNGQFIQLPSSVLTIGNTPQQYAVLSSNNQIQTGAQYIQFGEQNGNTTNPTKSVQSIPMTSSTTSLVQTQQRPAVSASISLTTAQLQQILNSSQRKGQNNFSSQSATSNDEENPSVEIKQ